jgi:hypothetical protein
MPRSGAIVLSATAPLTIGQFRHACRGPAAVQEGRLRAILAANADSSFGERHRFHQITSFADYRAHVPVATYEDLEPYITAAMAGRPGQLTTDAPILFTMTSGTTGPRKYIPMTPGERRARKHRSRLWASALFHDHAGARAGRILSVVSPEVESYAASGIACGSESGHIYRTMPRAVRSMYSTPYDVFTLTDYEAKYYTLLRIAAGQDIGCLVTANPSTVVLLAEQLGRHTEAIIRDIRDGTLRADIEVPKTLRASLRLTPERVRAAHLEQAAAAAGDAGLRPADVWPRLAVIGCWTGGSVRPYLSRFDRYFAPATPVRDLGYLATELAATVPLSDGDSGGVAAVATDVLEFYPAALDQPPAGTELLGLHELDVGATYNVVVTTAAGLYRYDMNDIVEVVDRYEQTPVLRFVQKGDGIVSLTGEKLTESQVVEAVAEAFPPTLDAAAFVAAVAEFVDETPRVVFLAEADWLSDAAAADVVGRLDVALNGRNSEYQQKRRSGRYGPPVLRLLPVGELDRHRRRSVEAGRADGQFKILRLTSDATFARQFAFTREVRGPESAYTNAGP